LPKQSEEAITYIKTRLSELTSGNVNLNTLADESNWKKVGVTAYSLKDNPVIRRFMKPVEEDKL
jgi:hypothetical protein